MPAALPQPENQLPVHMTVRSDGETIPARQSNSAQSTSSRPYVAQRRRYLVSSAADFLRSIGVTGSASTF